MNSAEFFVYFSEEVVSLDVIVQPRVELGAWWLECLLEPVERVGEEHSRGEEPYHWECSDEEC